jgi:hypothetical protein
LSPSLNRTGTIYGCLYHYVPYGSAAFGAHTALAPTETSIQNHIFIRANVSDGQGVIVNYLPSDEDDLQFLVPDTSFVTRHATGDDAYLIVILCQGLQASSQVKVEFDVNFELIPEPGQGLAGMETPALFDNAIPALEVAHIKANHREQICRITSAYDNGSLNMIGVNLPQQLVIPQSNMFKNAFKDSVDSFKQQTIVDMAKKLGGYLGGTRNELFNAARGITGNNRRLIKKNPKRNIINKFDNLNIKK